LVPVVLGFLALLAAVGMGALHGSFLTIHFVMGGAAVATMVGGLFWLNDTAWREMLGTAVYTLFFVTSLVLLYLISANRQGRLDLTRDKLHTLSPQTEAVLRQIPPGHRVVVQVFAPIAEHQSLGRLLDNCRRASGQFAFEIYDPTRDLEAVMQAGPGVRDGRLYAIHLDSGGQVVARDARDEFRAKNSLRESVLTNLVAGVLRDQQKAYYMVTGHGERKLDGTPESFSVLAGLVAAGSFPVKPLRLAEGRLPEDMAGLIIAGPQTDLSEFEHELLVDYLAEGGDLLLFLDPVAAGATPLPLLESVAAEFGIEALNNMVVDPIALNAVGYTFTPQANITNHPIGMGTNGVPFNLIQARPLVQSEKPRPGVRLEGLLTTHDRCWSEPMEALRSLRRPTPPLDGDEIASQTLAAAAELDTPGGRWGSTMRLVVVGDSDAFTDQHIERNGDAALFIVQSLNWMRGEQDMLRVPPRMLSFTPINLSQTRLWVIGGLYLGLGLLITIGGTAWTIARRRMR
jgi:hypothetical protein